MGLKYAVVGVGGIGGYFGGKLAHAGKDVHFLFHSDYAFVKENGLQVDSVDEDFLLTGINVHSTSKNMPQCDVILVCLKSINNKLLNDILPPILHKDTIVLLIQNGLGVEEDVQKQFPGVGIAGGLAFICSAKVGPGHISHMDYGRLSIGSYSCPDQKILQNVCEDFIFAGVEAELVDLDVARWKKLVWNIPFNGMTVVLNTTTDKLMNNPATACLVEDMMFEVVRAANHLGLKENIDESYVQQMLKMTRHMKPYAPSMKLDFDFHRPLEIDYIYSRPIQVAKAVGYEMTCVSVIERQLRFIENQYSQ